MYMAYSTHWQLTLVSSRETGSKTELSISPGPSSRVRKSKRPLSGQLTAGVTGFISMWQCISCFQPPSLDYLCLVATSLGSIEIHVMSKLWSDGTKWDAWCRSSELMPTDSPARENLGPSAKRSVRKSRMPSSSATNSSNTCKTLRQTPH